MKTMLSKEKLSTALINDVLIEMGFENQLLSQKFRPNFESAKLFGKVRTSKLMPITDEDPEKIHDILKFIPCMREGEILVIAKGFENMAFFGELMARVSLRAKVQGVVVDGVTRDRAPTRSLQFPVFAKGVYPKDLYGKVVVESCDAPVEIDTVNILSGDYLFADSDAVVIIPKSIVTECIQKAEQLLHKEFSIIAEIEAGTSVEEIFRLRGGF